MIRSANVHAVTCPARVARSKHRSPKASRSIGIGVFLLAVAPLLAQEPVNEAVIGQIKMEGFQHSAVMETLSWLTDVHGPRLTGSPSLRSAGEWARGEMTRWGLVNAALEPYGSIGRGWTLERYSIEMLEPQY